jgi:hypothetical protein
MFNDIAESSDYSDELSEATEDEAVVENENNANYVVDREHPASDRDFAVVAVLAALATEMDARGRNCRRCGPECSTASPTSIARRC